MVLSTRLSCVVVDDQVMFLELLVAMLRSQAGLSVAGQGSSVAAGQRLCRELRPDLLILDLALPDGCGLEVLSTLHQEAPDAGAIILSAEAEAFVCPEPLRRQVEAVIDKSRAYADLNQVLAAICRRRSGLTTPSSLTAREEEILGLIRAGFSNQDIATALHLSRFTVETHRKRIVAKLGVRSQDLVRCAPFAQQF